MNFSDIDIGYMKRALDLARTGLGRTAPNPSVGCVIVRDGAVVGSARTADGGRPHAEVLALAEAGARAAGADVYVTLEPCSHVGVTGACAAALAAAGVGRVFVACHDPDLRVNGRGVAMLREAGIQVYEGVCESEALEINRGFILSVIEKRPLVTLKMAVSADGKIAGAGGVRVQITGAEAQAHMHRELRARHDGIAVGVGTVIADNPLLTTRVEGLEHQSVRVVFGDRLRIPESYHLAVQNDVVFLQNTDIKENLESLVNDHGVTRLLVEGGARLMQAFLKSRLWDDLYMYRSPMVIGEGGLDVPEFGALSLMEVLYLGKDVLEVYKR
jgi:diaminohydroxyphosphoribosylaminopyrimidine deaminase/5-amino-6-(5-phosphoribosylamino)uracil reductase